MFLFFILFFFFFQFDDFLQRKMDGCQSAEAPNVFVYIYGYINETEKICLKFDLQNIEEYKCLMSKYKFH